MHRFLRMSVLLTGLFVAVSINAADAPRPVPMTEDSLGPVVEQPIEFPHNRHAGLRNPSDPTNSDPLKVGHGDRLHVLPYLRQTQRGSGNPAAA